MESPGAKLKKIRLEKGISLEEVHKRTKVHLNILMAIEGDSLSNISPIYLKGFLKLYCKALGVDPKDYIEDYKEIRSSYKQISLEQEKEDQRRAKESPSLMEAASLKIRTFRISKKALKLIVVCLIFIFLLMGLFKLGKFLGTHIHFSKQTPKKETSSIALKPRVAISQAVKPKAIAKNQAAAVTPKEELAVKKEIPAGIRLSIRARQNCWISLKVDGKVVFQRTLEKGRSDTWNGKDKMELSVGNAGAVELEVNGQLFTNLGKPGQALKNIVITKEGLKTGR